MNDKKERLDTLLTESGYASSREKARSIIMAGLVFVDNQKIDKPGTKINVDSNIEVKGNPIPYVSRGGLKLEKALKEFDIDVSGMTTIDIGASTGGFTDCMLQNGAAKVFAIDVGYGQLAWSLRTDNRVICMERTNIRMVTPEMLGELADFATMDVAFISITKVLPVAKELLKENAKLVCLIKPQFEAGREKVGKKGVVRDKNVHREVIENIIDFCVNQMNFDILGLTYSPIKGPEGNIEYLVYLSKLKSAGGNITFKDLIDSVVEQANSKL
jgi:23S rRNA (cytidine1920-2'-O)/16S rRNA (cytidine1409-2'-O)-methyltransferase